MSKITLIMLSAGNSRRFLSSAKKQWIRSGNKPLWLKVTNSIKSYYNFDKVIVVGHKDEINYMKLFNNNFIFVSGGNTRQISIKNALRNVTTKYVMITDVARCCVPKNIIVDLVLNKNKADCIVPYLNINDTIVYNNKTINRENIKIIQTPQLSNVKVLNKALEIKSDFTDDSSAIKNINGSIYYIKGNIKSKKLTTFSDLKSMDCIKKPSKDKFTGLGFDIHPFIKDKQMVLGGVKIDCNYGFKAHSDGDVLIHSLIDALLGAASAGDIGEFFPDSNDKYKDIDSTILLKEIITFILNIGFEIVNIDLTIIAQKPKITPYKDKIRKTIAKILCIENNQINIKATTAEKLGFIGRNEGVAVQSVAVLKFFKWR